VGGRRGRMDTERPLEFFCALLNLSLFGLLALITPPVQHEGVFIPFRANSNPLFATWTTLFPPSSLGLVDGGVNVFRQFIVVRRLPVRRVVDKNHRRHEGYCSQGGGGGKGGIILYLDAAIESWSMHLWIGGHL